MEFARSLDFVSTEAGPSRPRRGGGARRGGTRAAQRATALPVGSPQGRTRGRGAAGGGGPGRAIARGDGEALRPRPGQCRHPEPHAARDVRRGADLPHRPLPRQGAGPQHPGLPVRQRPVRADLESQLHPPHPDRRARDPRPGPAGLVLRGHRRLPRHGRDAPVPDPRLHRDGGADGARVGGDQRGEEQGLPQHDADRADRRRPRPVPGLPGHRGRRIRTRTPRRSWRCERPSTTGDGRASRSTCDPASEWPRVSGSCRSPSTNHHAACSPRGRASASTDRTT